LHGDLWLGYIWWCFCSGTPALLTRRFLYRLCQEVPRPLFGLADSDPHGVQIVTVLGIGALGGAPEGYLWNTPPIPIGVFTSDVMVCRTHDCCVFVTNALPSIDTNDGNVFWFVCLRPIPQSPERASLVHRPLLPNIRISPHSASFHKFHLVPDDAVDAALGWQFYKMTRPMW